MKKYVLTGEWIKYKGRTLYRIRAVRDFWDVREGENGGFVESEANLSHESTCWLYDMSKAFDGAELRGCEFLYDDQEAIGSRRVRYVEGVPIDVRTGCKEELGVME